MSARAHKRTETLLAITRGFLFFPPPDVTFPSNKPWFFMPAMEVTWWATTPALRSRSSCRCTKRVWPPAEYPGGAIFFLDLSWQKWWVSAGNVYPLMRMMIYITYVCIYNYIHIIICIYNYIHITIYIWLYMYIVYIIISILFVSTEINYIHLSVLCGAWLTTPTNQDKIQSDALA